MLAEETEGGDGDKMRLRRPGTGTWKLMCSCGFCVEVFRSSGTAVLTLGGEIWVGDKGLGLIPMWTAVTSRVQEFTEG